VEEDLAGHVVLLTGGSSGIGRAVVAGLAARGAHTVVLDRAADPQPSTGGGEVHYVLGDVTDPESNEAAVATALKRFGRLDHLVGNAGVHDGGHVVEDLALGELADLARRLLDVNVVGYLLAARAAAGPLRDSGGTIVYTLSDASFIARGIGAGASYIASKHAALGAVRALAAELAPDVRVNAVAPGGVHTPLAALVPGTDRTSAVYADPAAAERAIRALNPLGVMLTAEQLVPHYLFLLSGASAGLTGHVLRPDGGLSLG
jgi:2,3-dihydroxy-2,3-dihydrophenylpropionate dehydrogenase